MYTYQHAPTTEMVFPVSIEPSERHRASRASDGEHNNARRTGLVALTQEAERRTRVVSAEMAQTQHRLYRLATGVDTVECQGRDGRSISDIFAKCAELEDEIDTTMDQTEKNDRQSRSKACCESLERTNRLAGAIFEAERKHSVLTAQANLQWRIPMMVVPFNPESIPEGLTDPEIITILSELRANSEELNRIRAQSAQIVSTIKPIVDDILLECDMECVTDWLETQGRRDVASIDHDNGLERSTIEGVFSANHISIVPFTACTFLLIFASIVVPMHCNLIITR